jgi:polysaccharide transporter, PST family
MKNFLSLYGVQIVNGLVPIFLFPYLLAIYGADRYEDLVLAEVLSLISLIVVSFGFEITSISAINNEKSLERDWVSYVFFFTIYSRLIIWILVFSLVLFVSFLTIEDKYFSYMVIGWMLFPLGFIFYSNYFHLAVKNNFELFLSLLVGRGVGVALVGIGFHPEIFYIPYVLSIPFVLTGVFFSLKTIKSEGLKFYPYDTKKSLRFMSDSFNVFRNSVSLMTLKEFNVIIVSAASSESAIASLYSVLDKFMRGASAFMRPLSQVFLPKVLAIMAHERSWFFNPKFIWIVLIQGVVISVSIFFALFFPFDLVLVEGDVVALSQLNMYLPIMMIAIYFGVLNYYFLVNTSVTGNQSFYLKAIISGFLGIFCMYIFTRWFGAIGFSIAFIVPEGVLFLLVTQKLNKFV